MKCITVGGPKGLTMGAANCYAYNPFRMRGRDTV